MSSLMSVKYRLENSQLTANKQLHHTNVRPPIALRAIVDHLSRAARGTCRPEADLGWRP